MNILMDWDMDGWKDRYEESKQAWSWLGTANKILSVLFIIWVVALIISIVFLIMYLSTSSKYKVLVAELNDLRKQRKRIKRGLDRIENPTDSDMDELHDIEDDIDEKQSEVNDCLDKKQTYSFRWKAFLFIFGIALGGRMILYNVCADKIQQQIESVDSGVQSEWDTARDSAGYNTLDDLGANKNTSTLSFVTDNYNGKQQTLLIRNDGTCKAPYFGEGTWTKDDNEIIMTFDDGSQYTAEIVSGGVMYMGMFWEGQ